jgi:hypothetical protein
MSFATRQITGQEKWDYRIVEQTTTLTATDPTFILVRNDSPTGYTVTLPDASSCEGKLLAVSRDETAGYSTDSFTIPIAGGTLNTAIATTVSPDGTKAYTLGADGSSNARLVIYDLVARSYTFAVLGFTISSISPAITSPDGTLIYCLNAAGTQIRAVSLSTFATTSTYAISPATTLFTLSPDGTTLYYPGNSSTVKSIDTATGTVGATYGSGLGSDKYNVLVATKTHLFVATTGLNYTVPTAVTTTLTAYKLSDNSSTVIGTTTASNTSFPDTYCSVKSTANSNNMAYVIGNVSSGGIFANSTYTSGLVTSVSPLTIQRSLNASSWRPTLVGLDADGETVYSNGATFGGSSSPLITVSKSFNSSILSGSTTSAISATGVAWNSGKGAYSDREAQRQFCTGTTSGLTVGLQLTSDQTITVATQASQKINNNSTSTTLPYAGSTKWFISVLRNGLWGWQEVAGKFGVPPTDGAGYFVAGPSAGNPRADLDLRRLVSSDVPFFVYPHRDAQYVIAAPDASLPNAGVLQAGNGLLLDVTPGSAKFNINDYQTYWFCRPNPEMGVTSLFTEGTAITTTASGTVTAYSDADGRYNRYATGTTLGATAGLTHSTFTLVRTDWSPVWTCRMKVGNMTGCWAWIGLFSTNPVTSLTPSGAYASFLINEGVLYSATGLSAGDQLLNTSPTELSTLMNLDLKIAATSSGVDFYVNNEITPQFSHTIPIPNGFTGLNWFFTVRNSVAGTAKSMYFGGCACRHE